jgi:hypothetical protein
MSIAAADARRAINANTSFLRRLADTLFSAQTNTFVLLDMTADCL